MRSTIALLSVLLVASSFSGCLTDLLGGTGGSSVQIAKKAVMTINEQTFSSDDEPRIEDVIKTRFEYTHRGPDAAPADLSATFIDESGTSRTRPLSTFTTVSMIHEGDVVKIPGVNFTSGLTIKQAEKVLATRGGLSTQWFTVGGGAVPMAATKEGVANFDLTSSSGFRFNLVGANVDETGRVENAQANVQFTADGTMSIRTILNTVGPRIELRGHIEPEVDASGSGRITQDGSTFDAGFETRDMKGTGEGLAMLQFDGGGALRRTGSSGSMRFDGRLHVWDKDHPKAADYEPEDIEHPMVDEREAYSEEAFTDEDSPPGWAVRFLERLWSMEIGVGDDYRIHAEATFEATSWTFDHILQVAGTEARTVGATVFPTFRVTQASDFTVKTGSSASKRFDVVHGTYWISRDHYLPVYAQVSTTRSFDRSDVDELIRAMGSEAPIHIPDSVTLVVSGEQSVKLSTYSGDFHIAPIMGLVFANPAWVAMLGGGLSSVPA